MQTAIHPIIRKATKEDAIGISMVQTNSWQSTYKGIVNSAFLDNLNSDEKAEWWTKIITAGNIVWVADVGSIIGFATGGKVREVAEFDAELYAIYLLDTYKGQGIGKMLFSTVVKQLCEAGASSMMVWVLKDNLSKAFYLKLGGEFIKEEEIEIGNQKLVEEAYGWKDLKALLDAKKSN